MRKKPPVRKPMLSLSAQQASKLWKSGRQICISGMALIRKRVVTKAGKNIGLIAKTITSHDIQWIYYPRKEHFESFDRGVRELKRFGPGDCFRGSVGSISITKLEYNCWKIEHIQAHFKTAKDGPINRALATKYGGWRHRLLSEILKEAKREKKELLLWIPPGKASSRQKSKKAVYKKILKEAAEKEGFTVKKDRNFLVASYRPKKQKKIKKIDTSIAN